MISIEKQTILTGYYWYCFSDGTTPVGADCEFEGPHCNNSAQALKAWNELPRNAT